MPYNPFRVSTLYYTDAALIVCGVRKGAELGRLSRARHEVYMVISETLTRMRVTYTFPAYAGMESLLALAARPLGEGAPFSPAFMQKRALHL